MQQTSNLTWEINNCKKFANSWLGVKSIISFGSWSNLWQCTRWRVELRTSKPCRLLKIMERQLQQVGGRSSSSFISCLVIYRALFWSVKLYLQKMLFRQTYSTRLGTNFLWNIINLRLLSHIPCQINVFCDLP